MLVINQSYYKSGKKIWFVPLSEKTNDRLQAYSRKNNLSIQEIMTAVCKMFGDASEDTVTRYLDCNGKPVTKTETIDHSRGLCGKPDVSYVPLKIAQANPPHCLCCGSEMHTEELISIEMHQLGMYWLFCPACPPQKTA